MLKKHHTLVADNTIIKAQLKALYSNVYSIGVSASILVIVAYYILNEYSSHLVLASVGLILVLMVSVIRAGDAYFYFHRNNKNNAYWLKRFSLFSVLSPSAWSVFLIGLYPVQESHKMFTAFILIGIAMSAVSTLSYSRTVIRNYLSILFIPFMVMLYLDNTYISIVMLIFIVLFYLFLFVQTQKLNLNYIENIEAKVTNQERFNELKNLKLAIDLHSIVSITDVKGDITSVNDKFAQLSQYTSDELMGKNSRILHSGYNYPINFYEDMWQTLIKGDSWKGELRNKAKDGSFYWLLATIVPFMNQQGKPEKYIAISTDITHIKELEAEQEESKAKLYETASYNRSLIESSLDALVTVDNNGGITDVNLAMERITGFFKKDLVGTDFASYFTDSEKARTSYIDAYKKGSIRDFYLEIKHKDGYATPVFYNASAYRDAEGEVVGIFGAARDISKQLEIEGKLIEANKAKSEFLANMSHEIRTPMHGILSFAKFGVNKADIVSKEKLAKYFANILVSGERLLHLLDDLLDLSKLEAGKMKFNKTENNLINLIEQSCLEQEQKMKDLEITVKVDIAFDGAGIGIFDEVGIGQVITNLLSNAIKFSPENSIITIMIAKDSENLKFSLQDQGIGIPTDELEEIFDAFIQSSKTKTGAGGTGLGLAICKKIIEGHGGKVWAENGKEEGALLTFVIPREDYLGEG